MEGTDYSCSRYLTEPGILLAAPTETGLAALAATTRRFALATAAPCRSLLSKQSAQSTVGVIEETNIARKRPAGLFTYL